MSRAVHTAAALLAVLLTVTGCGFLDALAHPEQQEATASTSAAPTAPTPDPHQPVLVADVDLRGADGGEAGRLSVTVGPVATGLVLPFPQFFEDCPVSGPSLQYVPVTFTYSLADSGTAGLAGHLTVTPGSATPAGIGDVGVFFEPSPGHDEYCRNYPPLPTTDTFWARGTVRVTGYVVLDQAVTAATPKGRAEVFPTLQARIDHLRTKESDTLREGRLSLGVVRTGAACADDPSALCVPLG